jgi:hypothetical protein
MCFFRELELLVAGLDLYLPTPTQTELYGGLGWKVRVRFQLQR